MEMPSSRASERQPVGKECNGAATSYPSGSTCNAFVKKRLGRNIIASAAVCSSFAHPVHEDILCCQLSDDDDSEKFDVSQAMVEKASFTAAVG